MKKAGPNILYFDVETTMINIEFDTFQLKQYTNYIPYTAIKQDFSIWSVAWQWLTVNSKGKLVPTEEIQSVSVANKIKKPKDVFNDKELVKILSEQVTKADVVIYHNGDHFDLKKLRTRLAYHRLPNMPVRNKMTVIDTYKQAKQHLQFTSNRLDYLGIFLKVGTKTPTIPGMWDKIMAGDVEAIKQGEVYNRGDITLGVAVTNALMPYINVPNFSLFNDPKQDKEVCGVCGQNSLIGNGHRVTVTRRYERLRCTNCGHNSQKSVLDKGE